MEITKLHVKIKTLDKKIFAQLEDQGRLSFVYKPHLIHGWVNSGGWWLIIETGGRLMKVRAHDYFHNWVTMNEAALGDLHYSDRAQKYQDYIYTFEQIFI